MNKESGYRYIGEFRKPMIIFGIVLAGLGGLILSYLGVLVLEIINNPAEVKVVELILAQSRIDGAVIFGVLGEHQIDINLSEPVKLFMFSLIGVLILLVLGKIIETLISAGISIIRFAVIEKNVSERPEPIDE